MTDEQPEAQMPEVEFTAEDWWRHTGLIKYDLDPRLPVLADDGSPGHSIMAGEFSLLPNGEPYAALHPMNEQWFIDMFRQRGFRLEKIVWEEVGGG